MQVESDTPTSMLDLAGIFSIIFTIKVAKLSKHLIVKRQRHFVIWTKTLYSYVMFFMQSVEYLFPARIGISSIKLQPAYI